jgi:hypothetical protein
MSWIVFELDTLCDHSHRVDFRNAGEWDTFHSLLDGDALNEDVAWFMRMAQERCGMNVLIFTGRPLTWAKLTQKWLQRNNLFPDVLAMRKGDDWEKDAEMKVGILEAEMGGKENVLEHVKLVVDVNDRAIAALRDYGLKVWVPR